MLNTIKAQTEKKYISPEIIVDTNRVHEKIDNSIELSVYLQLSIYYIKIINIYLQLTTN